MTLYIQDIYISINNLTGGYEVRINGLDLEQVGREVQQFNGAAPDLETALDQVLDVLTAADQIPEVPDDWEDEGDDEGGVVTDPDIPDEVVWGKEPDDIVYTPFDPDYDEDNDEDEQRAQ